MDLAIVVLAAGQGKRMHSDTPKVLQRLAGRALLAHVLDAARELAPQRIVVVYGHGGDRVRAAFPDTGLTWVEQRERLGTGHALMQALPEVPQGAQVLVLSGDVPLISVDTLQRLLKAGAEGELALLTSELGDARGYGRVVRDGNGRIARIAEEKDATPAEREIREWYTGFLTAPRARLESWLARIGNRNAQGEYYLTDVIGLAAGDGLDVASARAADLDEVQGVNSRGELARLERALQRGNATRLLEAGVTLADPERIDVRGSLACGRDVSIDVNCVFEGEVTLGNRVRIGPNCVIKNMSIADDSEVHAFTLMEDAAVGARCRIGPYARLRPGARLEEAVHIGNFVEVKASRFAAGSKANHLAYIGDSEVGARVNVGAGTITCNYDGASKHRTVIEDDCFIGSNATLVAPVKIAQGSYIGAGSTISKDTPPGQLTLARARQVSVEGWKPPKKEKR
ncbi:MAG: bifunctional UDP-N-acetylglucosamine diphosphorylase/glucosamine-1-phosphate N-acetyltransferase GlmU [Betaproteobacteria bacterium]|nr:bifunctional UDP-N-acetylglucosamine diphosphorylase/glucosamine-1-phosphate N-acetyltransferase GlmU [Betaproteobacteria bacterium]